MARRRWKLTDIQAVVDGDNPFIQVGYDLTEESHKVGDVWTDKRGDTWEQKNGYRVKVNKTANAVREGQSRECEVCGKDIFIAGSKQDDKFFYKTQLCYDCLIEKETRLRLTGDFDAYEKSKVLSNQLTYLEHIYDQVKESYEYLLANEKISFVNEFGDVETWTNNQRDVLLEGAKGDMEKLSEDIKETKKLIESLGEIKDPYGTK